MEEENYILPEIPEVWVWTQLHVLGKGNNAIVDGPFGSNLKTSDYIDDPVNGIPVLTTKNLEGDYGEKSVRFISQKKYEELKRSQVNGGDILVAKIGSIGKTGIYPKHAKTAIIPANLLKFTVTDRVNFKFVFTYLNYSGFQKLIKSIARATAQPAFNVTKFRILSIPIPNLPEQNEIVSKIEELFSDLDNGVENLKKAREQLKTYRQAVLKYAFEGKLTEAWRARQIQEGNPPEPADRLLERIQKEREAHYKKQVEEWKIACKKADAEGTKKPVKPKKPKNFPPLTQRELAELPELPKGWVWVKLGVWGSVTGGLTKNQKRTHYPLQMPFLRVANVYSNHLDLSEIHEIGLEDNELERVLLHKNDLLVVEGNGSIDQIGRVAIWKDEIKPCVHQNHLIKVRLFFHQSAKYVLHWLLSHQGRLEIKREASSTSGLYTLSLSKVDNLPIPLCSIDEQTKIISEIESRLSVCDKLEQTIDDNLKKAEALRQSILKKAFSGELTRDWREQHPELISGENSAEKLLERIKVEKARLAVDGKKRRPGRVKKK